MSSFRKENNSTNSNNRRRNTLKKGLKDYAVPLIGLLIVIVIIFSVFSGSGTNKNSLTTNENQAGLELSISNLLDGEIVYSGGNKVKVDENNKKLYKGDKITVKDGSVGIVIPNVGTLNLDKNGELEYTQNGELSLLSSYLWVNSTEKINVKMKFGSVEIGENSNISLNQNEMGSSIYLLNGTAQVSNLVGKKTDLTKGKKITISESIKSSQDVDLSMEKEDIDSFFKSTEWYVKNDGDTYLNLNLTGSTENEGSGQELAGSGEKTISENNSSDKLINIENPTGDESLSETQTINIEGTFKDGVAEIKLNGINAVLNTQTKKFIVKNYNLDKKTNDLIFKVYDINKDLIGKYIQTIYYENGNDDSKNNNSTSGLKNFSVDASDFKFTAPSTNGIYTTTNEDFVSIYGKTPNIIKKVNVNGYTLKSFNGTSWRYHASIEGGNLKDGSNVYEIKYYGENDKLLYTNNFTIIKKAPAKKITTN